MQVMESGCVRGDCICQLGWATVSRCPVKILDVSVRLFLDEINILISGL